MRYVIKADTQNLLFLLPFELFSFSSSQPAIFPAIKLSAPHPESCSSNRG